MKTDNEGPGSFKNSFLNNIIYGSIAFLHIVLNIEYQRRKVLVP